METPWGDVLIESGDEFVAAALHIIDCLSLLPRRFFSVNSAQPSLRSRFTMLMRANFCLVRELEQAGCRMILTLLASLATLGIAASAFSTHNRHLCPEVK
jgi:hypothetical protein